MRHPTNLVDKTTVKTGKHHAPCVLLSDVDVVEVVLW